MKANEKRSEAHASRVSAHSFRITLIAALALLFAFGGWGCSGNGDNPSPAPAGSGGVSAGGSSGSSGGDSGGSSGTGGVSGSDAGDTGGAGSSAGGSSGTDGGSGKGGTSGSGGSLPDGGDADVGETSETGGSSGSGGSSGTGGTPSNDGDASSEDVASDPASEDGGASEGSSGSSGQGGSSGSDAGDADAYAETGGGGSAGNADAGDGDAKSEPPPPKPFKCSGWTRDLTFPSGLDLTGDIWGSGPNDIYVACGKYGTYEMAHYDGQGWSLMTTPPGIRIGGWLGPVWGFSVNEVWAGGREQVTQFTSKARLLRRVNGGEWQVDQNLTLGIDDAVTSIWGANSTDVFTLVGIDSGSANWDAKIFRRNGDGSWSPMTLPPHSPPLKMNRIWGKSASEVYAVGSRLDSQKNSIKAILWKYDGATWQDTSNFPSDVIGLSTVHGADSEIWVVGSYKESTNLHGVRLSSTDLMSWDRYNSTVTQSDNAIWSPWQGAALAGGSKPVPPLPGAAQTSTLSLGSWTPESGLDGIAGYITGIWPVPNSNQVWLSTYSTTGNAGVYTGNCQ